MFRVLGIYNFGFGKFDYKLLRYRCVPTFQCLTESSAEFEIFGTEPSGTIHASCFDEDPNGISILTKSDSKTCCKEENIIFDVNEEKSCEDMDNRRSVFSLGLLSS